MWTRLTEGRGSEPVPVASGTGAKVPLRVVDEFIPPADAGGLVRLAADEGLWEEAITTARDARGEPAARRAENAWLPQAHPLVARLRRVAADAFGLTPDHVEALRLVRYRHSEAQFAPHVDWDFGDDGSVERLGQRVASALVYLTDVPEGAGGTTWFPHFDLEVRPAAGRAVVWPNVDSAGKPLMEVEHAAIPLSGAPPPGGAWEPAAHSGAGASPVKVAVNVWLRDRPMALSRAMPPRGGSGSQATAAYRAQREADGGEMDYAALGPVLLTILGLVTVFFTAAFFFDG